jgi:hypothetical protein
MNAPKIKSVNIDDLIPYALNSRTHSETQINQIAASIKEFGFTNPVLTDSENGIIAGHGRVLAAQKLKLKQVPVIELSHLTNAQKKAYVIADNKLALNSGWDDELLKLEIESLQELEFDTDLLGWEVLPQFTEAPDYSILNDEDVSDVMQDMTDGVKKAIQIEFKHDDYSEAAELIKFWRENNAYIGGMIIKFLKNEKEKI